MTLLFNTPKAPMASIPSTGQSPQTAGFLQTIIPRYLMR